MCGVYYYDNLTQLKNNNVHDISNIIISINNFTDEEIINNIDILQKIQYLDLIETNVKKIPKELVILRHLYCSNMEKITEIPKELVNLEVLEGDVSHIKRISNTKRTC